MAYSYSLIRSTPFVPRFPSFGNLDEMYRSKAAVIPKRNTRAKLNHRTANVTARAYDNELIVFNIITVYVISIYVIPVITPVAEITVGHRTFSDHL